VIGLPFCCPRSRICEAMKSPTVVPAEAGTHTPCRCDVVWRRDRKFSGYGSPPSRGRQRMVPCHSQAGTTMREPVLLPRCRLQIGERGAQQARVVRTEAQRAVTSAAKQPAHAARDVAVIDAKDTRHRAADRAGMALPLLQRAIVCQRESIAAGALRITIVGLKRPPHAPAVVLQKARTLAAAMLGGWLAGRLVLVGSWAVCSSLRPFPARCHQPGGRNNRSVRGMEHQGDWRRVHRTQP
jgi:hypothetical protein